MAALEFAGRLALVVGVAAIVLGRGATAVQPDTAEYRVKAAVLYRFPQFVEWPPAAAARPTIDICVAGPNPFGGALADILAGETLAGRAFRTHDTVAAPDACHVVFINTGPQARRTLLARLAGQPVLTVSDASGFLEEGGIVELRVVSGRIRFRINAGAADRAGLRLAAQLLRLATEVQGGER